MRGVCWGESGDVKSLMSEGWGMRDEGWCVMAEGWGMKTKTKTKTLFDEDENENYFRNVRIKATICFCLFSSFRAFSWSKFYCERMLKYRNTRKLVLTDDNHNDCFAASKGWFCFEVLLRVHSQDTSKEKQLIICNNLPIYFCPFSSFRAFSESKNTGTGNFVWRKRKRRQREEGWGMMAEV